jgi:Na+-transporting methylmalonyl-CoA/oxaloacetate decarboxylase gamma subunit
VNEPELWMLSINAFAAVLLLLSLLAGAIGLLTAVFRAPVVAAPPAAPGAPDHEPAADAATVAAIHATVQRWLPGGRVVRIEEVR